ncbi:MAG: regulatory protein RecX [Candidatus Rokubacteria bacterium]|nr:regulatory protein RecX [Candidatus Rokubacteria bacterium]MBI3108712.1 regulatory protein RecX [Candidatus Rokubacteria bacterium]
MDAKAARVAAFDLLARKAWSARELTARLARRGAPAEVARAVVADLESRGYVNDEDFARWWAEVRARGRKVGSLRLARELRTRGIAPALAAAAVASAFAEVPEAERALEAARRRLPALLRARPERAPARLGDYLLRRGYPARVALATVTRLLGGPEAAEEPWDEPRA